MDRCRLLERTGTLLTPYQTWQHPAAVGWQVRVCRFWNRAHCIMNSTGARLVRHPSTSQAIRLVSCRLRFCEAQAGRPARSTSRFRPLAVQATFLKTNLIGGWAQSNYTGSNRIAAFLLGGRELQSIHSVCRTADRALRRYNQRLSCPGCLVVWV